VYYGKQNNLNSDFYNSYRSSYYQYDNGQDYLTLILKVLVIILLLGLIFFGYVYSSKRSNIEKHSRLKISQEILKENDKDNIKSKIEVINKKREDKSQLNLTQDDIANIVKIVMNKMSQTKKKHIVSDDEYTKELLYQEVDRLNSHKRLNTKSINTKKIVQAKVKLNDINHYNKIIINNPKKDKYTNDTLSNLSIKLSNAIDNDSYKNSSNYTKEITKEIKIRSNEMRIIIVEKGDSLSKIAKRAYGDYDSYVKIFEANPEIIKNPNEIYAGQRLRIPM